jgi:hypothetical protein
MKKKGTNLKEVEINYITFESGDNEALIDCKINDKESKRASKLIISMSDLNKLISSIKRIINNEVNIECHKINSTSSFYQIDLKKSGLTQIDLSSFFFSNSIKQIIA